MPTFEWVLDTLNITLCVWILVSYFKESCCLSVVTWSNLMISFVLLMLFSFFSLKLIILYLHTMCFYFPEVAHCIHLLLLVCFFKLYVANIYLCLYVDIWISWLKHSWLTVLCQSLLYSKVTQFHAYII